MRIIFFLEIWTFSKHFKWFTWMHRNFFSSSFYFHFDEQKWRCFTCQCIGNVLIWTVSIIADNVYSTLSSSENYLRLKFICIEGYTVLSGESHTTTIFNGHEGCQFCAKDSYFTYPEQLEPATLKLSRAAASARFYRTIVSMLCTRHQFNRWQTVHVFMSKIKSICMNSKLIPLAHWNALSNISRHLVAQYNCSRVCSWLGRGK